LHSKFKLETKDGFAIQRNREEKIVAHHFHFDYPQHCIRNIHLSFIAYFVTSKTFFFKLLKIIKSQVYICLWCVCIPW